ncbi:MAG: peptide ligase PGM1-related protein [Pseudomonadota bacterium]
MGEDLLDTVDEGMPGTAPDVAADFAALQQGLARWFERSADRLRPQTVVVLPSLSLDQEVLGKITGVLQYEQRLLCLLLLLRYPNTRVVYLSSEPVPQSIIDYYLHLLTGIPRSHAMGRLTLIACHDGSARPLTEKVLERPRVIARLRAALQGDTPAHLTCFNVSPLERSLALTLGLPVYGCDPDLLPLGSKSGSRRLFRAAGLLVPDGAEDLRDEGDIGEALVALKARNPGLRRAVVKVNEGFSGEGNAIFDYRPEESPEALRAEMADRLPKLRCVAEGMGWPAFAEKFVEMGGVVEAFVEGKVKRSPSAQYRIDPLGQLDVISTHDQVTTGTGGQVFEGCRFPANAAYRLAVQEAGRAAAEELRAAGVLGRFGVDFVSVREAEGWRHYALEINLRKGGTTHPFLMLQSLTDGHYDTETGTFRAPSGRPLFYYASDNLAAPHYRGLTPDDLIDIAVENGLHFHTSRQEGVVFHLIGALSEFGKLGLVCVAGSERGADRLYRETVAVLDKAGTGRAGP